jgi:hypothetical protein
MKARTAFRGLKLQLAIRLVAEASLTEEEIAVRLRVKLQTLKEVTADPYFAKRVEEERSNLKREDEIRPKLGMPPRSKSGSPGAH